MFIYTKVFSMSIHLDLLYVSGLFLILLLLFMIRQLNKKRKEEGVEEN